MYLILAVPPAGSTSGLSSPLAVHTPVGHASNPVTAVAANFLGLACLYQSLSVLV